MSSGCSARAAGRGNPAVPQSAQPEPRGGFGDGIIVHTLVLPLLRCGASIALAGPARPCRGCAMSWAGISLASSSAEPRGTISDGRCQDPRPRLLPRRRCVAGVERGALLASTLLGPVGQGGCARALAPASPSNAFWQRSTLPAWREGGTGGGRRMRAHPGGVLSRDRVPLGVPVPEPALIPPRTQHPLAREGAGDPRGRAAGESSVRAGRDQSKLRRWPWKLGISPRMAALKTAAGGKRSAARGSGAKAPANPFGSGKALP